MEEYVALSSNGVQDSLEEEVEYKHRYLDQMPINVLSSIL